jgi:hypothetical protein
LSGFASGAVMAKSSRLTPRVARRRNPNFGQRNATPSQAAQPPGQSSPLAKDRSTARGRLQSGCGVCRMIGAMQSTKRPSPVLAPPRTNPACSQSALIAAQAHWRGAAPLACRAAIPVLRVGDREGVSSKPSLWDRPFVDALRWLREKHPECIAELKTCMRVTQTASGQASFSKGLELAAGYRDEGGSRR